MACVQWGLAAHNVVFIFLTMLWGIFRSSVLKHFAIQFPCVTNMAVYDLHSLNCEKIESFTSLYFNISAPSFYFYSSDPMILELVGSHIFEYPVQYFYSLV